MMRKSRTPATTTTPPAQAVIPHQGALCRYDGDGDGGEGGSDQRDGFELSGIPVAYVIDIAVVDSDDDDEADHSQSYTYPETHHRLCYTRKDLEYAQRLFAILDTESVGLVERRVIRDFVTLRCPVFWRRDDDLKRLAAATTAAGGDLSSSTGNNNNDNVEESSPTFDEIWDSVVSCSSNCTTTTAPAAECVGVEGWMVFCRFIALAQYLEAKRRFSARHLQQTMRHRNSPRGSEVVVVDVPPPTSPASLSPRQLADYERQCKSPLPLPELDLDHSLLAAHDTTALHRRGGGGRAGRRPAANLLRGSVKIGVFGPTTASFSSGLLNNSASTNSANNMEFTITYTRPLSSIDSNSIVGDEIVVRRSMADMKWLNDTFASHKVLGGTLCGRILPPFPGSSSYSSSSLQRKEDAVTTSIKSTGGAITNAAANGVGRVRDFAVSYFRTYLNTSDPSSATSSTVDDSNAGIHAPLATSTAATVKKLNSSAKKSIVGGGRIYPESYYRNPTSPACRSRQIERYLNYLLEHPALSTSFPLNTILRASQSGLEAAKESLEEIKRARNELKDQTPHLDDGKISIPFWPASGSSAGDSSNSPNLAWVRTAAQAAMALKVHGMLETTGMVSASARLQNASLPSFGTTARSSSWEDDEGNPHRVMHEDAVSSFGAGAVASENEGANNFEEGVVSVQSELAPEEHVLGDDGYDLLPLPVPAPERRILSAGSEVASTSNVALETRFHYGSSTVLTPYGMDHEQNTCNAFLGDISVDDNIDKLREVIGSVDNTLSRCLASLGGIVKGQRERQALHLDIVRGLDSWSGMRGKFISQRSLLKGVAGIEQSRGIYDEGDVAMIDDISWQTSLAISAVAAAEDVRSAVRVSRTAANAKVAASSAAFAAQNACGTGKFSTIDEARAAQTRASIAQSHAIHAAVVEHEAKSVKRRATLALAHDVKCWNVHRKRELHRACIAYARSQHEATRRAVDAWSSLRDGFIGTTNVIPTAHERRPMAPMTTSHSERRSHPTSDANEATSLIYDTSASAGTSIVAVEHHSLTPTPRESTGTAKEEEQPKGTEEFDTGLILPFATAAPIPEEDEDFAAGSYSQYSKPGGSRQTKAANISDHSDSRNDEILSGSMQSLIDGLMNWGGGLDAEEDHFALPAGMASSIVLQGASGVGLDESIKFA